MPQGWEIAMLLLAADEAPASSLPWWLPFAILLPLLYLIVLRPSMRQQKEQQDRLAGLKKNDRVETIGGIRGTVVVNEAGSDEVILRVDDNNGTRLHFRRDAIARVLTGEKADGKDSN